MPGYVKATMGAVRALFEYGHEPELLAGYLTLRRFAHPAGRTAKSAPRDFVSSGARSIQRATGCTDYRAKQVLLTLLQPPEALGGRLFLTDTGRMRANAKIYEFTSWDGPDACLPAILWDEDGTGTSPLQRLLTCPAKPSRIRDALYVLVALYERVDYGTWLAAPPARFPYGHVEIEGDFETGNDQFALGLRGQVGDYELWLIRSERVYEWVMERQVAQGLFGDSGTAEDRLASSIELLLDLGLACEILIVETDNVCYPLWVFPQYSATPLQQQGIDTGLARACQRAAERIGDEAARRIAGEAMEYPGTGLFYCLSDGVPRVRRLLMPRLHAATPRNLSGMNEMAARTTKMRKALKEDGDVYADGFDEPTEGNDVIDF